MEKAKNNLDSRLYRQYADSVRSISRCKRQQQQSGGLGQPERKVKLMSEYTSLCDSFLEQIETHPSDNANRLIFADWLEERGKTTQAEILRRAAEHFACGKNLVLPIAQVNLSEEEMGHYQGFNFLIVSPSGECRLRRSDYDCDHYRYHDTKLGYYYREMGGHGCSLGKIDWSDIFGSIVLRIAEANAVEDDRIAEAKVSRRAMTAESLLSNYYELLQQLGERSYSAELDLLATRAVISQAKSMLPAQPTTSKRLTCTELRKAFAQAYSEIGEVGRLKGRGHAPRCVLRIASPLIHAASQGCPANQKVGFSAAGSFATVFPLLVVERAEAILGIEIPHE